MKLKFKICISVILSALMLTTNFTALPVTASAAETSTQAVGGDDEWDDWEENEGEEPEYVNPEITIRPPVAGEKPDMNPVALESDKYSVSVAYWYYGDENKLTESSVFEEGVSYSVLLNVHYNSGYAAGESSYVNGSEIFSASYITADFYPASALSGKSGDLDWEFDLDAGVLMFTGDGATASYESETEAPWSNYKSMTDSIIFIGSPTAIGKNAFCNLDKLESLSLPNSVTTIMNNAFSFCSALTMIKLPGVETIGDEAFSNCSRLSKAIFGNNLKTIGKKAFADCLSLKSVTIPESIRTIGEKAFGYIFYYYGEEEALSFDIYGKAGTAAETYAATEDKFHFYPAVPKNGITGDCTWSFDEATCTMTISGSGAMANYNDITDAPWYSFREDIQSLVIEDGVTSIGEYAFFGSGITGTVYLPSSVRRINYEAFDECYNLNSINLADVEYIGTYAFYKCKSLMDADLTSAKSIGSEAFAYSGISMLTLGNNIKNIYDFAFSECSKLMSVSIPANLEKLSKGVFQSCNNLSSVFFPEDSVLTEIEDNAFWHCSSLGDIEIPDTVKSIGKEAFACGSPNEGLGRITLSKSLETIGNDAFLNTRITEVTLHGGIKEIGYNALGYYKMGGYHPVDFLTIYGVPGTVAQTYADSESNFIFYPIGGAGKTGDCGWYYDEMNNTLEIFGSGKMADYSNPSDAPWYGMNISDVRFGSGVECIGKNCFANIPGLFIPETVTSIADGAVGFDSEGNAMDGYLLYGYRKSAAQDYADKYENIRFIDLKPRPNYMGTVGAGAAWTFDEDTGVLTVYPTAAEGKIYDYGQFDKKPWSSLGDKVERVVIEEYITEIGDFAFSDMKGITNVELPKTVKKLGVGAFYNTNLDHLIVPNSECQLGYYCFGYEDSPEGVWFYEMEIANIAGYVGSTTEQYAKNNPHVRFYDIEEIMEPMVFGDVNLNGKVDIGDATEIQYYLADLLTAPLTDKQKKLADVDGDGKVTINDATMIQYYLADMIPSLTPGGELLPEK